MTEKTLMEDTRPHAQVLILTPDPQRLTAAVMTKPFMLYVTRTYPLEVKHVLSLPNVMEAMGGPSGGGGPPGFSALQWVMSPSKEEEGRQLFIAGFLAGSKVVLDGSHFILACNLGTVSSAAVAVTYLSMIPSGDLTEDVEQYIEAAGFTPIPLVEYTTPQLILNALQAPRGNGGP